MNASTIRLVNSLWIAGNNSGEGFAAEPGGVEVDEVDAAIAAYEADGYVVLHRARTCDEVSVVQAPHEVLAIGDAHGAWCVTIPADVLA